MGTQIFAGPGLDAAVAADLAYNRGYTYWTDFLFQRNVCSYSYKVSGAVAERIKINSYANYFTLKQLNQLLVL